MRLLLTASLLTLVSAANTQAQSSSAAGYWFGGWTMESRQAPDSLEEVRRVMPQGISFGVGFPVSKGSLELSGGWSGRSTLDWYFSYTSGTTGDKRTTDRDVPLLMSFRRAQACAHRGCPSIVIGAGLNAHIVRTRALTDCGHALAPRSCSAVNRSEPASDHLEPMIAGGADFVVRLNGRVDVAPGFRIRWTHRTSDLTGYAFRGPRDLSPVTVSATTAIIFHR